MPAIASTQPVSRRLPALRDRMRGSRRWRGWRVRFACAALLWSVGCAGIVSARETPASRSAPKSSPAFAPKLHPGRAPDRAIQRRPSVAPGPAAAARRESLHCPGLSSRSSETQRQSRRGACLRRAQAQDRAGQNGPSSHSQRAIQALTKAISVVRGKPMRRKSPKRY